MLVTDQGHGNPGPGATALRANACGLALGVDGLSQTFGFRVGFDVNTAGDAFVLDYLLVATVGFDPVNRHSVGEGQGVGARV